MKISQLLRNGLVAGVAAGLGAAVVFYLLVEPALRRALVIEEARATVPAEGGHVHEGEVVSRTVQVVFGGITSVVVAILFGLIFAVVFARARHRLPGATDLGRSAWLALCGFGAFVLMPALKIPGNPPAVGDPESVGERTLIYVLSILVGLLVIGAVFGLDRLLAARKLDGGLRASLDALAVAVLGALALWLVPDSPDTIPSDVTADLIWDFRVASVAQLGAMWATLGCVFGLLATRRTVAAGTLV